MAAHQLTAFAGLHLYPVAFAIIAGFGVRIVIRDGKPWMPIRDLTSPLGYSYFQYREICRRFEKHGHSIADFIVSAPTNEVSIIWLINEEGLRLVCELYAPKRIEALQHWLDEGGMHLAIEQAKPVTQDVIQTDDKTCNAAQFDHVTVSNSNTEEAAPGSSKVIYLDENHDPGFNLPLQPGDRIRSLHAQRPGSVVRVYHDGSACILWDDGEPQAEGLGHERMPRELLELVKRPDPDAARARRKEYCRELCKIITRYVDDAEVTELARALEGVSASILARRYCPGLNAAAYDVFARLGMKGGVQ